MSSSCGRRCRSAFSSVQLPTTNASFCGPSDVHHSSSQADFCYQARESASRSAVGSQSSVRTGTLASTVSDRMQVGNELTMGSSVPVYGTSGSIQALLDGHITRDIMRHVTDQGGSIVAEYVWIGGTGADLRSKARFALHTHV